MSQQAHSASSWEMPAHGEFCWTEIATTDAEKCKSFYNNVFGWQFGGGGDYIEFTTSGGGPVGGMYQIVPERPVAPSMLAYVAVDDVDASAARAAELGGQIVQAPSDIEGVGRFAVVRDPAGASVAIFELKHI